MERSVTGKMDIPLNRKSRSKSWSGIERTKEKEDSDASTHHSVIQSTPQWLSGGFGLPPLKRELKSEKGLIGNASMKDGNLCNMFNPAPKRITWVGVPQEYEMRGKGFKKGNETGLLEGSDLLHHGKHEQNETEMKRFYSEWIKLRNQQKEETTNLHSEFPWKVPGASFDPGFLSLSMPPPMPVFPPTPMLPIKTRSMGIEQAMLHHHDSRIQEMLHHNSRIQEMLPRRIGSTLMGSRLIPPGKHKQTQTEITGSFLSNTCEHCHVPTWEISEKFPSPGDGLKANRIGRVPKSSHSKYPRSCSLSLTSLADESAAGSSTANPESKEIVTHSIMKPSGTSGSSGLSCLLPCSHSMVSLSKIPCAKNNFTQVNSSSDMLLNEFTPVVTDDFDDENYTFQCSCAGLYQCSVTGLVFLMKGDADVVYRTVPWNRRLLAQHHKKPAGPLFDIKCQQQSVCQLCLPHCELISTGGAQFLKVAHVDDEGIEFITPQRITESHVVINITGFSGYGNVKDEDSPPDPVQALVLLFYKPPVDPDLRSILSLLLLPRNIVIRDVQRTRRKLIGDEKYVDTSPHCKLHPKQVYTLSTVPQDDLIKVEPTEADFDDEYRNSYFTSFQVILRRILTDLNLSLKDKSSSTCVWERNLSLFSRTVGTLNLPPSKRLLNTRSCFTEGISAPNLSSLVDKLLEKTVITDAEREAADAMQNRGEKARFVIDTVRSKGDAASSEFINILRELDRIFFEHLGLN